ncbi:hypothetical protein HaLaN_26942, partial [Haematococcus lacustris]
MEVAGGEAIEGAEGAEAGCILVMEGVPAM